MKNSIWDIQGGVASVEARESPLTWESLEASSKNSLEWKGPSPMAQCQAPLSLASPGQAGTSWPRDTNVGAGLPGSSPAQRERGAHVPAPGHMFWGKSSEGSEFRELHFLSPLPGPLASVVALGTDSKEEARRRALWAWALQGSRVQRPRCSSGSGCVNEFSFLPSLEHLSVWKPNSPWPKVFPVDGSPHACLPQARRSSPFLDPSCGASLPSSACSVPSLIKRGFCRM